MTSTPHIAFFGNWITDILNGHAINAAHLALALRNHPQYDALTSRIDVLFLRDLVAAMAAALTAMEFQRGADPWEPDHNHPLDWDETCEAFANRVVTHVLAGNEAIDDLNSLLEEVITDPRP